jgi:hypothetical protein
MMFGLYIGPFSVLSSDVSVLRRAFGTSVNPIRYL